MTVLNIGVFLDLQSCDTEDRRNGCWKFSFATTEIHFVIKYIKKKPVLLNCYNISHYCFSCIFTLINTSLMRMRLLSKTLIHLANYTYTQHSHISISPIICLHLDCLFVLSVQDKWLKIHGFVFCWALVRTAIAKSILSYNGCLHVQYSPEYPCTCIIRS